MSSEDIFYIVLFLVLCIFAVIMKVISNRSVKKNDLYRFAKKGNNIDFNYAQNTSRYRGAETLTDNYDDNINIYNFHLPYTLHYDILYKLKYCIIGSIGVCIFIILTKNKYEFDTGDIFLLIRLTMFITLIVALIYAVIYFGKKIIVEEDGFSYRNFFLLYKMPFYNINSIVLDIEYSTFPYPHSYYILKFQGEYNLRIKAKQFKEDDLYNLLVLCIYKNPNITVDEGIFDIINKKKRLSRRRYF